MMQYFVYVKKKQPNLSLNILVVCGNTFIAVSIVSGILDHVTRMIGNLEASHASHQFGSEEKNQQ